jgi:hypothetical protein
LLVVKPRRTRPADPAVSLGYAALGRVRSVEASPLANLPQTGRGNLSLQYLCANNRRQRPGRRRSPSALYDGDARGSCSARAHHSMIYGRKFPRGPHFVTPDLHFATWTFASPGADSYIFQHDIRSRCLDPLYEL